MTATEPSSPWWSSLVLWIAVAIAAGIGLGWWYGPAMKPAGALGALVVDLIKGIAAPLVFFAILNAILRTDLGLRGGMRMVAIALLNVSLAVAIGLALSNLLRPGDHLHPDVLGQVAPTGKVAEFVKTPKPLDGLGTVSDFLPRSVAGPFVDNAIMPLVILSLLFGFALRRVRTAQAARGETGHRLIEDGITTILEALTTALGWIVRLVPFAVFGVVARAVGEYGLEKPLAGLAAYVGTGVLGMALHILVVYHVWILLVARIPLLAFWREARHPVVYALGTNSSLATLPLTLRALDRLGISRSSSNLGACVGTNLNNDGIVLYEAMAALLVAQAAGMHLDFGQQMLVAVLCVVAALGVSGFPEAGFVSLAVVLATVGLPTDLLLLLLTVDWIIARCRSATNVLGDMTVSIALDRFERGAPWRPPAETARI